MARAFGLRHREAHVGEQAARRAARGCGARSRRTPRRARRRSRRARARRRTGEHRRRSCEDHARVKAIRIHEDGGPEVLRYEDVPDPVPADGEALVELRAASLNHLDVWIRKGLPSVPKPRILGADGAGVIAGTDERVVINPAVIQNGRMRIVGENTDGTYAELIAVPRDFLHPIPDGLGFEEAAAFPLVFETAYRMLVTRARLAGGRVGAGLGHRRRRRDRRARDRQGARRPRRRHVVERREARAGVGARRGRVRQPCDRRRRRRREGGRPEAARTSSSTTSARRPGSARSTLRDRKGESSSAAPRPGPNPPAALHRVWWKQLSILGSTMGSPDDFQGAYDLIAAGKGAADRRPRVPARRGRPRPTSGSRPASSSARSCCGSRARSGGRVALAAKQRAGELGRLGADDEDHQHASVLGRHVAELEVLDVDRGGAEDLRDPREDAGPVGDADADPVELSRLGLIGVRQELVPALLRLGDRTLEEGTIAPGAARARATRARFGAPRRLRRSGRRSRGRCRSTPTCWRLRPSSSRETRHRPTQERLPLQPRRA